MSDQYHIYKGVDPKIPPANDKLNLELKIIFANRKNKHNDINIFSFKEKLILLNNLNCLTTQHLTNNK